MGLALNNKATPRLEDVPAAQNEGPSQGAVGPAPPCTTVLPLLGWHDVFPVKQSHAKARTEELKTVPPASASLEGH